jgi:hypothetical protein
MQNRIQQFGRLRILVLRQARVGEGKRRYLLPPPQTYATLIRTPVGKSARLPTGINKHPFSQIFRRHQNLLDGPTYLSFPIYKNAIRHTFVWHTKFCSILLSFINRPIRMQDLIPSILWGVVDRVDSIYFVWPHFSDFSSFRFRFFTLFYSTFPVSYGLQILAF